MDVQRPLGATEDDPFGPSGRRAPTPRPTRQAGRQPLKNRTKSAPSCLWPGAVSGLLRVSRRQIHGSPVFSRPGRLAVYNCNARFCLLTCRHSDLLAKSIERPVDPPSAVTGPCRGGIGKISRQISPLVPGAHQVKSPPVGRL
jgi:hypothetical protein